MIEVDCPNCGNVEVLVDGEVETGDSFECLECGDEFEICEETDITPLRHVFGEDREYRSAFQDVRLPFEDRISRILTGAVTLGREIVRKVLR